MVSFDTSLVEGGLYFIYLDNSDVWGASITPFIPKLGLEVNSAISFSRGVDEIVKMNLPDWGLGVEVVELIHPTIDTPGVVKIQTIQK